MNQSHLTYTYSLKCNFNDFNDKLYNFIKMSSTRIHEFAGKSDYEIALLIDQQEYQTEALKYQITKENEAICQHDKDYAIQLSNEPEISQKEAVEMEHEWLKQKYGMNNTRASARVESNLHKALKNHKIDIVTYHDQKAEIENRVKSVFDDGSTCSTGIIDIIRTIQLNKFTTHRILCSSCDHFSIGSIDYGYGCGYRNTQMLFTSIREDKTLKDILFNNNNTKIPSITKIQSLIENAWSKGFDVEGRAQLGGKIVNTTKWIGATEVCAMLSSLRIKCELIDIQPLKNVLSAPLLFKVVRNYFEEELEKGAYVHPIYLQHDGHSRTIIGIEGGKNESLLIFDPSSRKVKLEQFRSSNSKSMQLFRNSMQSFNKNNEYQLVIIRDVLTSEKEYQRSKILTSTRITS